MEQRLTITPIHFRQACAFVQTHHRHHQPPQGHKFSIAVSRKDKVRGVAIVGRPVSRVLDDGFTLEVTRLCTDGTPNACSKLYAVCRRIAQLMGYRRIITYTLDTEPGTSLKASGWNCMGKSGGGSWDRFHRPRQDVAPTGSKIKYGCLL